MATHISESLYGYSVPLTVPFDIAVERVRSVFQLQGFGAISEIDVQAKMQEKLGKEMGAYVILGMCNPLLAYAALQSDPDIGLLLPCNVVVRESKESIVVSAQKPDLIGSLSQNEDVQHIAQEAQQKILAALGAL